MVFPAVGGVDALDSVVPLRDSRLGVRRGPAAVFPEPQKMTLRQDGFAVDEQVPVLVPESASAGDLVAGPPTRSPN